METLKNISSYEKYENLKDTIYQLYSKEGRSKVYISKLLKINRKTLGEKIKEWNFPDPEPVRYLNPSSLKFLKKNKKKMLSMLKKDFSISTMEIYFEKSRKSLVNTFFLNDEELKQEYEKWRERKKENHDKIIQQKMDESSYDYNIIDYDDEEWKNIPDYDNYMISNYGRIKSYSKRYDKYYLIKLTPNKKKENRFYVRLVRNDGKSKNLQVARLVGFIFVDGYSEEKNTINHYDGNTQNNYYKNLFWTSQGENNLHAYRVLKRKVNKGKKYKFRVIRYKDKYEFKTVTAFAKFLGKSETQTRRYIDQAKKYNIRLIE